MGQNLKSFNFASSDQTLLISVLIGLLGLVILAIVFYYFKKWYANYQSNKQKWERFYQVCQRRRLKTNEIDFLKEIITKYNIPRPVTLVRFLETFNRYVFREVQNHREEDKRHRENLQNFVLRIREKLGFANPALREELTSTRDLPKGIIANASIEIANLKKGFEARITNVDEEGLTVSCPDYFLREEPVRVNQSVELEVKNKNDAQYVFKTVVWKIIPGPPGFLCLDHSRNFNRIQRRKYTRIDMELSFQYFFLNHLQEKEFRERRMVTITKDLTFEEGEMLNVSAGGMAFESDIEVEPESYMGMRFYIPGDPDEFKNIVGQIVSVDGVEDDKHKIAVKFLKIGEKPRERISRWIYDMKLREKEEKKKKALTRKKKVRRKKPTPATA